MLRHDEHLKVCNNTVPEGILGLRVDDSIVLFSNDFFFQTLGADGNQILGASWDHFFADSEERQQLMIDFVEHKEFRNFRLRLKPMALENNVKLTHAIPATATAFADPDMVQTVIHDLLSNA